VFWGGGVPVRLYDRGQGAVFTREVRGILLNPRYADAYANRGLLRLRRGRKIEAEADFARGLALKPELKASLKNARHS
jgi:Tfp pilus assembly protein PilF